MINNHKSVRWRRIFSCNLLFLMFTLSLTAQDLLVTGRVTDGNLPISGASIIIKNTSIGAVSDYDGRYSITAKPSDTLQISYLGYTTLTIPIQSRTTINVILQEDATALGEVQINAGYYTTTDREKTGSISRITAKEIEGQPVNNPLEALQGRVTGLDIVQTTGLPGGGYTVRIRGQNSISAGNDPLYVVDGVPYDMGSLSMGGISLSILPGGKVSPLNTMNPSAIESIEVLKDADATAIYGSRGANGVILITTKKGKAGKTTLSIETSTTLISVTKNRNLLKTGEYLAMRREAFEVDGYTEFPSDAYDINGKWNQESYTDWQKEFIGNTARKVELSAELTGGNEQTRFRLGGSAMKETTVFPFDYNYKRIGSYTNLSHTSNDERFQLQFSANYALDSNQLPANDITGKALVLPPNAPNLYNDKGELNWEDSTWDNPFAELESSYKNKTQSLTTNWTMSYNVLKGLKLKTNIGYNQYLFNEYQTNPHTRFNPAWGLTSASSNAYRNDGKRNSWIVEPQLDGLFNLGKGIINITMGGTFQEQKSEQLALFGYGYTNDIFLNNISAAQNTRFINEESIHYRYQGAYGRLNYILNDTYILNLTGRRDGTSRFGPGEQFAAFGAVGAAWIFSKNSMFKNSDWMSFGKMRASFGSTGNDQIGDYQYLSTYKLTESTYDGHIGLSPARLFNSNFSWERNKKSEAALEIGLWKNRFHFEIAYYSSRSNNQLVGIPLPGTTGFESINSNLNAMVENRGWEIEIKTSNFISQLFVWNSSFQISIPKNELLKFDGLMNSTYANSLEIGHPLSIYKMYHYKGVNPVTGLFEFEDYDENGQISGTEDLRYIADFTPKFYGSISNTLSYKDLHLDFLFQFVKKKGFNELYGQQPAGFMANQPTSVLDHWQKPNDVVSYQHYTAGGNFTPYMTHSQFSYSNGVIGDASFIRLKSLALTYKLPLKNANTNSFIFIKGQNLMTFSKFKGGDPEQMSGYLPPMKRISLGVRLEL